MDRRSARRRKPWPSLTTPESRAKAWKHMLSTVFQMIFYQQEAVRYLSRLSALPMIRSRLLRISPLMDVLRTPAETELALADTSKVKSRTMKCQHRYSNMETALKKHGGKVVTAHCQLPGCDYRMRKLADGKWEEWPREARPWRAASSAFSPPSQPFSARHKWCSPPWDHQPNRGEETPTEYDTEPWEKMTMDQDHQDSENSEL